MMEHNRDVWIEEMAKDIEQARIKALDTTNSMNYGFGGWYAKELYENGYRKIYDDHQRQCTCYVLGCQMAEGLKKKVAMEIFEEIDKRFETLLEFYPLNGELEDAKSFVDFHWKYIKKSIMHDYDAELKKKYTESEKDDG